jgi:hypothetical protein
LNWVTLLVLGILVGGGYAAVKFGPVYFTRYKVDEVLTDIAFQAIDLRMASADVRYTQEQALLDKARERITSLGVDGEELAVYFEPDLSSVHADYSVVVTHPALDPTRLEFNRTVRVPGDDRVP